MNEVLLEVEGLTVDSATGGGTLHAVRGVSFDVRRGESAVAASTISPAYITATRCAMRATMPPTSLRRRTGMQPMRPRV